ncbi:hypothetical protein GCM10017559_08320 [Streptosporangium longisporum]|uniref:HNH nuclease domain-containing protein n=1 Tax=Streptosporangium longisporum TaxID=46187 RepID=A0ABN3XRL4_9ACTN
MTNPIMGLPERFWAKAVIDNAGHDTPCLTWTAFKQKNGYGKFNVAGKALYAHRVAYEALNGPIPEGLHIDHLCRNRACVNATHLEAVTNQENILRGETIMAANAAKTHCQHGHEYTPENTRLHKGSRHCRTCARAERRARTERERATKPVEPAAKKTHCPQGHPYDEVNTYAYEDGRRSCRICRQADSRRSRERRKTSG